MYACGSSLAMVSRQAPADPRGGLEPAGAPTAVEVQVVVGGAPDDRRGVGADVDDAGPGAQQVGAGEDREQLHRRGHLPLDDVERAALAVAVVGVDAGAHHEFALVRLRHVHVHRVGHHDGRVHRLEQLGHQRLQRVALHGRADAEHVGQHRGVPGRAQRDLPGGDVALGGAHPGDPVAGGDEPGDLAVLDEVDAGLRRRGGRSPRRRSRVWRCRPRGW